MTHRPALLPLAALGLLLAQCQKSTPTPDPASQLPPATQTGADTFGCLVNGKLFIPNNNTTLTSYYTLEYDPTFNGGSLSILAKRFDDRRTSIIINRGDVSNIGNFSLTSPGNVNVTYTNSDLSPAVVGPCDGYRSSESKVYCKGQLTITRLDVQAGIVSGTFACTLWQPGCDTVRITRGRFDKKL